MKRWGLLLALAVLIGGTVFFSNPERQTKLYFYRHLPELEEDIARWQAEGTLSHDPAITVNIWDGGIVEYLVAGRGLVSASTYYGFFYSVEGGPVSFQNSGQTLTRRGQYEWTWQGEGDNRGYVELLRPGWYYFQASL